MASHCSHMLEMENTAIEIVRCLKLVLFYYLKVQLLAFCYFVQDYIR